MYSYSCKVNSSKTKFFVSKFKPVATEPDLPSWTSHTNFLQPENTYILMFYLHTARSSLTYVTYMYIENLPCFFFVIYTTYNKFTEAVEACDCSDRFWVRFPLEEMKYWIFSFPRPANGAMRGVELRQPVLTLYKNNFNLYFNLTTIAH